MRRTAVGIWDFLVGRDWIVTGVVIGAGILTAVIQSIGLTGWWLIPEVGIVTILWSLGRSHRRI